MFERISKDDYEISPLTMAILSLTEDDGSISTHILEVSYDYIVKKTPTKLIDEACRFFGSSLQGRMDGTRDISKITHKPPIAIDPSSGMYFFPTASPTSNHCSWIAHSHVDFIDQFGHDQTVIVFKNGKRIILDVSYGSMTNQLNRTAQFRYSLEERIKTLNSAVQTKPTTIY